MAQPGSDFVKVHSKRYRAWRIVRTQATYLEAYRKRIQKLDGYRTAIIFPEQLLNLNQAQIWRVTETKEGNSSAVKILTLNNFKLEASHSTITTVQEVFEYEAEGAGEFAIGTGNQRNFLDMVVFTSKADALKYAAKRLAANLA